MRTDRKLVCGLLRLVLVSMVAMGVVGQAARASQPNIVVIMTDDQRVDEASLAMPNTLSLIADEGLSYTKAIVQAPLCGPSRATFLTGQYAHNHGVLANQRPYGYEALDDSDTLPVWLQAVGYHTIFVGKYVNGYGDSDPFSVPPGWSDWRAALSLQYYDYFLNFNGVLTRYGSEPEDYRTDVMADQAVAAIRESPSDRPFFLWVATLAPHEDLCTSCDDEPTPAPRHAGAFDEWIPESLPPSFNEEDVSDKPAYIQALARLTRQARAALLRKERKRLESLLAVDDLVARVVGALADRGDLDNTVVLFTSDNGYAFGEHRNNKYFKKIPYEESLRVPLYVRGPGLPAGRVRERLVSNQDLAVTISGLAGATPGHVLDGVDMKGIDSRAAVYLFNSGQKGPPAYQGVRTSRWVYLRYETGDEELYDLQGDPHQLESHHADSRYADIRRSLRSVLNVLRNCAGATCNAPRDGL